MESNKSPLTASLSPKSTNDGLQGTRASRSVGEHEAIKGVVPLLHRLEGVHRDLPDGVTRISAEGSRWRFARLASMQNDVACPLHKVHVRGLNSLHIHGTSTAKGEGRCVERRGRGQLACLFPSRFSNK